MPDARYPQQYSPLRMDAYPAGRGCTGREYMRRAAGGMNCITCPEAVTGGSGAALRLWMKFRQRNIFSTPQK
ncbi:hypothetical protein [Pseudarthrobacter sp. MEB009]|uniref:hypothetical protein n=1 Tax=Pseudarthrobacter sp. MEB009 TaxID=3040326 RepID=UPI002555A1F4|nr:hypothetical protein [Pseudarthrobacter sp. MEB009]